MGNWEYVQVDIPKELYDRIARFSDVEEAILQDMTEWVKIMEDEERLAAKKNGGYTGQRVINDLVKDIIKDYIDKSKVRFKVYVTDLNSVGFHYEVWWVREEDTLHGFVGEINCLDNEALLRIAKDDYGISEEEIEFVN